MVRPKVINISSITVFSYVTGVGGGSPSLTIITNTLMTRGGGYSIHQYTILETCSMVYGNAHIFINFYFFPLGIIFCHLTIWSVPHLVSVNLHYWLNTVYVGLCFVIINAMLQLCAAFYESNSDCNNNLYLA